MYTVTKLYGHKWKDIQLEQIKHLRITSVDIIVHKTTGIVGLHHGQCLDMWNMQEKDLHNRLYVGQYQRITLLLFLFMTIYFPPPQIITNKI